MTRPRIVWGFDTTDPANYYFGPAVPGFTGGVDGPGNPPAPAGRVDNSSGRARSICEFALNDTWKFKSRPQLAQVHFDSDAQRLTNERNIAASCLPA